MTKQELRDSYIAKGWEVQPLTTTNSEGAEVIAWTKVSEIEGKVKYDVNVVSPDDKFGTAQVVVINDGTVNEEAKAVGFWEEKSESFAMRLRAFLNAKETGSVYAIVVNETFESDQAALVTAYAGTTTVTAKQYIVRERGGTFDFKEVTTV